MNIVVIGCGNVGGGPAALWRQAGHQVTALGRNGASASAAGLVAVAVPGNAISEALAKITGVAGKIAIDAPTRSDPATTPSHRSRKR